MVFVIDKKIIFEQKVEIEAESRDEAMGIAQNQEPAPSDDMYFYDNYQPRFWNVSVK